MLLMLVMFPFLAISSQGCVFAQSGSNGETVFQNVYKNFLNAPISFPYTQNNQILDEIAKLSTTEDFSSVVRAKTHLMLCLSYIFRDDLVSAYKEILKALPLMEKSVPQGQDSVVFSKMKSSVEKGVIKDHARLVSMPEFSENARQIAERINLLIEGRENYRKSIEQCIQRYRPILKTSIDNLIKENNLEGSETEILRKKFEQKYLGKIEKDGYFLISDLKQDFTQYLFEKLFSD